MVRRLVLLAALVAASLVAHADAAPTSASAFAGLYEIRLDRSGLREVLASTEGGVVEMSPDRTQVVVTRNYGDYDRVTLKDHARVPLIRVPGTGPGDIEGIQWSPDARTLLFNRADDSPCTPSATGCAIWDTWLVNASGSHLRRVSRNARYPAFSPSSKRITFLGNFSTYDDVGELSVSALDGSGLRILDQQREAWLPAWSPNGKCVAYTAATFPYSYSYEVQVACLNGLHRNLGSGVSLGWSPDGAILKNRVREKIVVLAWLGQRRWQRLSTGTFTTAAWSPRGRWLAYSVYDDKDGSEQLFVMDWRRKIRTRLFREFSGPGIRQIYWSKDGRRLFFNA